MGVVNFRIEASDANAVRAFLNLSKAQQRAEVESMRLGQRSQDTARKVSGIGSAAGVPEPRPPSLGKPRQ